MDKYNFIKTSQKEVIEQLKAAGFQLLEESNGVATFLNDKFKKMNFDKKKVVYTNNLNV